MDRLTELSTSLIARNRKQATDILSAAGFTLIESSELTAVLFALNSDQFSVILASVQTIKLHIEYTLRLSAKLGDRLLNPL
jgi:hypothetical protein